MMTRLYFFLFVVLICSITHAQSRTVYVLIKEQKAEHWYCPNQQVDYSVYIPPKKLTYEKRQKVLNARKKKLLARDTTSNIKVETLYMKEKDHLVFYEYIYVGIENNDIKCKNNTRRVIKGLRASLPEDIAPILQHKLENNIFKERYLSHKILEIRQPIRPEFNLIGELSKFLRDNSPVRDSTDVKRGGPTSSGVRG